MAEVFYQSVGSKLNVASGGRFPLNFSHHLVKYFDGPIMEVALVIGMFVCTALALKKFGDE